MSFEHSSSLDDLLQSCKQESESVVIPELPEETPQPASADTTPTEVKSPASDAPPQQQPAAPNPPPKPVPKRTPKAPVTGKHGRPIKTDPYGNPIRKKKKDAPLRKPTPVNTVTPADIQKPQVSFMNTIANQEPSTRPRWSSSSTAQAYDHAVLQSDGSGDYRPKIRRMNDSTRAKEIRRRRSTASMPYERVTPAGQTGGPITVRRKKTAAESPAADDTSRIPDTLMEQPYEEAAPIQFMDKAEHTHIDLSDQSERSEMDIDVPFTDERRVIADQPKQERTYRKPQDKASISRDIMELQVTLELRVVLLGIITVLSGLLTVLDWLPFVRLPNFLSSTASPLSFLTIQILLAVLAIPISGDLLKNGFSKLLRLRADCDSLAALSLSSVLLSAILIIPSPAMLQDGTVSVYLSAALFSVWINAIAKKMIVSRAKRNFDVLSNDQPKYGIHYVENEQRAESLTRSTTGDFPVLAAMRKTENVKDFLKYTFSTDLGDKFCHKAVPIILVCSILFSVFIGMIRSEVVESGICYGVSIFALCCSACACAALTLVSNLPMASGTKRYVKHNGLLLGYQSVDDFFDVNTLMVDASILFPHGTTQLKSIQVVGDSHINESVQYAASLTRHGGSILKDLFANAILAEQQCLLPVENYAYEEGKGISGWIQNKRVLLGTLEMMHEHNIDKLPPAAKIAELTAEGDEALYLSVSGTLAAMYIIRLESSRTIKRWLHALEREHIFLLIRSNDALLSQRRVAKMFEFPEEMLKFLPARLEPDFEAETAPVSSSKPSMICDGNLPGLVQTLVGAKRIRSTAFTGLLMQAITAGLGLLYAVIFVLLWDSAHITGGILFLYQLLCTLITICTMQLKNV